MPNFLSLLRAISYRPKVLQTIYIHLHVSLLTLPIILFWGFPFSPWAIVGNLIFAPFLSLFLLSSSLLFITEMLHIPNDWAAQLLNGITVLWNSALYFTPSAPSIFSPPHILIACLIAVISAFIIHTRHTTLEQRLCCLLLLTACTWTHIFLFCKPKAARIAYSPVLACISTEGFIFCIDKGANVRNSTLTFDKVLRYNQASKRVLIFLKPTTSTIRIAHLFLKGARPSVIILPDIESSKINTLTRMLLELEDWSKKHNHKVIYVKEDTTLNLREDTHLSLKVKGQLPRNHDMQQTLFSIESTLLSRLPIFPLITRRERVLLQHQLKPMEDT